MTLARAAGNLAVARASGGDYEAALPYAVASREAFAASLGERHPDLVQADNILGVIHREIGDLEASLDALARAHALAQQVLGTTHRERVNASIELGATHLARGEPDRAVMLAQDALVVLSDPPGNPVVVAEARFLLARALGRSSGRAKTLAREALDTYASLGEGYAPQTDQIRDWLAAQP